MNSNERGGGTRFFVTNLNENAFDIFAESRYVTMHCNIYVNNLCGFVEDENKACQLAH